MTLARMISQNKLPSKASLPGLREMEDRDVPEVTVLFQEYMKTLDMTPLMTEQDIRHQLLMGRGTGEIKAGRREKQVVWTYVVQVGHFRSFFHLLWAMVLRS
jgi:glycylpeptide N-tetradecanoyltransferase